MADSETSRTLPAITRRNVLSAAAAYVSASTVNITHGASHPLYDQQSNAPGGVLALWRAWHDAHEQGKRLCYQQQRLETEVLKSAGSFPVLKLAIPGEDRSIVVHSCEHIDTWLPGDAMAEARNTAKAELLAKLAKWNSADEQSGYSRTRHAEAQVAGVEQALAKSLWEAPAQTTSDIIAKLHSIIETEDPGSHCNERPWPQLRMILADLVRIQHPA